MKPPVDNRMLNGLDIALHIAFVGALVATIGDLWLSKEPAHIRAWLLGGVAVVSVLCGFAGGILFPRAATILIFMCLALVLASQVVKIDVAWKTAIFILDLSLVLGLVLVGLFNGLRSSSPKDADLRREVTQVQRIALHGCGMVVCLLFLGNALSSPILIVVMAGIAALVPTVIYLKSRA